MTALQRTIEGGGFVSTCICGWVRYADSRAVADDQDRVHAAKCKDHQR